jgi:hypothetical protein
MLAAMKAGVCAIVNTEGYGIAAEYAVTRAEP